MANKTLNEIKFSQHIDHIIALTNKEIINANIHSRKHLIEQGLFANT
jgi:hypothetical protein